MRRPRPETARTDLGVMRASTRTLSGYVLPRPHVRSSPRPTHRCHDPRVEPAHIQLIFKHLWRHPYRPLKTCRRAGIIHARTPCPTDCPSPTREFISESGRHRGMSGPGRAAGRPAGGSRMYGPGTGTAGPGTVYPDTGIPGPSRPCSAGPPPGPPSHGRIRAPSGPPGRAPREPSRPCPGRLPPAGPGAACGRGPRTPVRIPGAGRRASVRRAGLGGGGGGGAAA